MSAKRPGAGEQAVSRVTEAIRGMILDGELLPGQQIRQEQMATRLGVSRLPVREGLRQLMADGLVSHEHNVGFAVTRLSQSEFSQIYLMRRLLESEVLASAVPADDSLLAYLEELNDNIEVAGEALDLGTARALNRDFHFAIFRLSPLTLVVAEIERIWAWAMPYHAVSLQDAAARARIVAEHRAMIVALREGRNEVLLSLMDEHRQGSEEQLGLLLRVDAGRHAV
ncbi:GntR family transcriptional regulator [Nocardia pseudovaccinii]|uniref:GntR family transcriptional regulator n=1 Tax=Nocardia pseudovaccinii TaxID=189540 RepID=UPI003D8B475B